MTSQGSAMHRFELALETGDPARIVPAALELPRPIHLSHAVRVLLALRDAGAHDAYRRSAARFASQLVRKRGLSLAEANLLYVALEGLDSEQPLAPAAALEALLRARGEGLTAAQVQRWLERAAAQRGSAG